MAGKSNTTSPSSLDRQPLRRQRIVRRQPPRCSRLERYPRRPRVADPAVYPREHRLIALHVLHEQQVPRLVDPAARAAFPWYRAARAETSPLPPSAANRSSPGMPPAPLQKNSPGCGIAYSPRAPTDTRSCSRWPPDSPRPPKRTPPPSRFAPIARPPTRHTNRHATSSAGAKSSGYRPDAEGTAAHSAANSATLQAAIPPNTPSAAERPTAAKGNQRKSGKAQRRHRQNPATGSGKKSGIQIGIAERLRRSVQFHERKARLEIRRAPHGGNTAMPAPASPSTASGIAIWKFSTPT